ncbi:MAG: hypothetical protein CBB68_01690 [Rhodospirillaceae bacterium TMED8]|jgi:hypothetical protein|nr:MAG: hypothetical protein CBB68_01690 [Rhodospirillaceae bacterium TMED8]|tara:strand:+ start:152 stop:2173 length:2022 start_codon:yes stop_codon:yes gene_type:complete
MALIQVDSVGQVGIVKETSPWNLPPNVWSDGNNVKTEENSIKKCPGYSEVLKTCPVAPHYVTQISLGTPEYWIVGGLTTIYAYDNTGSSTALNGAINSSVTTITVDSTVGFENVGTITIGTENITYTGKTSTQFTGCTRAADSTVAAAHDDNATVNRSTKWYNITRTSGGYSTDAGEGWTSTVIGGVLVMTNNVDNPQFWQLTDGIPLSSQKMQDLTNWPSATILNGAINDSVTTITVDSTEDFPSAGKMTIGSEEITYTGVTSTTFTGCVRGANSTAAASHSDNASVTITTRCKSLRAFRSFLISLNITKDNVNFPRLVKWSTEAATQTLPTSWNETTSTVDAGEFELADTKGAILDGLPLRDSFMIYKEDAVFSMTFVGTPFIFAFRQLSPTIGAIAKNCVAEFDGGHAIFGKGNFYVNDGQRMKPILPMKLKEYVFQSIDGQQTDKSFVVADYGRNEILFCFTSDGGGTNFPNKAVVWNYVTNTFTIRDIPDCAHMGYGNVSNPTTSTTWAETAGYWETATGPWTMSYDLQDKVLLFADPGNTKLYRDRSGNKNDTTNMESYIERTGLSLDESGRPNQNMVKRISAIYPNMAISSTNDINVYIGTQMSTEGGITWSAPVTFNPNTQSKVSVRGTGKYYAVKFESTTDMDWELDSYAIDIQNVGSRGSRSY